MSRNVYTGLHSTYRPPPPWDGTPAPEGEDLSVLATHWRKHGDEDGSLESRIHELILNRARYEIFRLSKPSPWAYEVADDAATNAMLSLGSPSWKPELGTWAYVDASILNYWRSQVRRKIRRFIPMISLDSPEETMDIQEPKPAEQFRVEPAQWDALYSKLSGLEKSILENYSGGRKGGMADLAAELGVDVRRVDNALERIKKKARELGIMRPSGRKRNAKQAG
jgi:DNA-directed RNA polymerase specialized sigma24 family protein